MNRAASEPTAFASLPVIPETATKYEILGVSPQATQDEIKISYRRMALLYHPDRHPEEDRAIADEVFKRISSAYRTLCNESERRRYDMALSRGEQFHEGTEDSGAALAEILAEIDIYEHIFSDEKLARINSRVKEIVDSSLIEELGEHVIAVWPMPSAPANSPHKGTYQAGAVVLTNLRLLLPFTYTWEEVQGNTKYKYTGAALPVFPLPFVREFKIISSRRVRNAVWVNIVHADGTTRFRPGERNLSKLLLVARLWGIRVEAIVEDARSEELSWALWDVWKWALWLSIAAFIVAAAGGLFWGGVVDNPIDLFNFLATDGRWSWLVMGCAAISASRIWRWVVAYEQMNLVSRLANSASAASAISTARPS